MVPSRFFTDPCASSPCLHGNCSRGDGELDGGETAYTCECSEGYEGERCDRSSPDPSAANWDPATPPAPELVTPITSTASAATQPQRRPSAAPSTVAPAQPTLQPWQPKPGQRLLVVLWEAERPGLRAGARSHRRGGGSAAGGG
ncbi:hypothetical protein CRUP_036623 [Coryphaenoides rupestris]|nr:hypothetical protein CRUP_036623 [Coryphaenoides rupestris]